MEEINNPYYFIFSFLEYFPRIETLKKMAKLNNLYDGIVESKRKSMKTGEIEKKINNNSADLLEHMVQACNDPENPTLTSEELRVRVIIYKNVTLEFIKYQYSILFYSIILQSLCWLVMIQVRTLIM
jgi:hypothetical protein